MTPEPAISILDAINDDRLFGRWFAGPSWDRWKVFLAALFALPMTPEQLAIYQHHTGRTAPPLTPPREAWVKCGRRSGKSLVAALISLFLCTLRDYSPYLAPGEVATGMVVSPDRRQSRIIRRYQAGLCRAVPALAAMIVNETKDALELSTGSGSGAVLETQTASDAAVRGYTCAVICNDEIAFLPSGDCVDPDKEIIAAERPCLVSLPGSLLLSISSPYARRGCLWEAFEAHYGKDSSPVLFWEGTSLEMNSSLDPKIVADAFEADPDAARSEWNGEFRSDCERLFRPEALDACEDQDRPLILPPYFGEESGVPA